MAGVGGWASALRLEVDGVAAERVRSARHKRGRKTRFGTIEPGASSAVVEVPAGTDVIPDALGKRYQLFAQTSAGAWEPVFSGYVTDQVFLDTDPDFAIRYTARDESGRLGGTVADLEDPVGEGELPGARIGRILDVVGVDPADRDLGPGQTLLLGTKLGSDLKAIVDAAASSELGVYFVSRAGVHVFYDAEQWHGNRVPDQTIDLRDTPGWSGRYHQYELARELQNVGNLVTVVSTGDGYTATREDDASQVAYGIQPFATKADTDAPATVDWIADSILSAAKDSVVELSGVTIRSARGRSSGDAALHDQMCVADIGDQVLFARLSFSADLLLVGFEGDYDPRRGWSWSLTAYTPLEIGERYDPAVDPGWHRYYMADSDLALAHTTGDEWYEWADEIHGDPDIGLRDGEDNRPPRHVGTFEPHAGVASRRTAQPIRAGGGWSEWYNRTTLPPFDDPYTAALVYAFGKMPDRDGADMRHEFYRMAGAQGQANADQDYWGWTAIYDEKVITHLELEHRVSLGQPGDVVASFAAGETDHAHGILLLWSRYSSTGLRWELHETSKPAPQSGTFSVHASSQERTYLTASTPGADGYGDAQPAALAIKLGDDLGVPTPELTEWVEWARRSYGFQ